MPVRICQKLTTKPRISDGETVMLAGLMTDDPECTTIAFLNANILFSPGTNESGVALR